MHWRTSPPAHFLSSPTCLRTASELLRSQAESTNRCARSTSHFRWAQARSKGKHMTKRTLLLSITAAGVVGAAAFGLVSIRRGCSAEKDEDSWELVLFIRHLPQLTAAEEREMQALNPQGRGEKQEELDEEQFLNEGGPGNQAPKPPTQHKH